MAAVSLQFYNLSFAQSKLILMLVPADLAGSFEDQILRDEKKED